MGWRRLLEQRRVDRAAPAVDEIRRLMRLAERALADAGVRAVSEEGRFDCAYDAARALATAIVRSEGYRVRGTTGSHYFTFAALEEVSPPVFVMEATYFNLCREKRNALSYVDADVVSETEVEEILMKVSAFRSKVERWLAEKHPELV